MLASQRNKQICASRPTAREEGKMFPFTARRGRRSLRLATLVRASGFALLCMAAVSTVHAQQNGQGGNGQGNQNQGNGPQWSATPELDSLFLFGTGVLGLGGYALTRLRSKRRS
jgi:hypothetical protein